MQDIRDVLSQRLRQLRERAGMSQEDLAHASKVNRAFISELERGRKSVGIDTLSKLAMALGVETSDLLKGPKKTNAAPRSPTALRRERLGKRVVALAENADEPTMNAFEALAKTFFREMSKAR